MVPPQAILFDLDGTIISEGDRFALLLKISEQMRAVLSPYSPSEVADALETALTSFWAFSSEAKTARLGSHVGIRHARELVIADTFRNLNLARAPDVALAFSERFSNARAVSTRLFGDALSTLEALQRTGIRLALVTNGAEDIQREKLVRFDLVRLFEHVQIEGEHGFGKPEDRAYTHAMASLGVEPAHTWMVGDNLEWEVAAPQKFGIRGIWYDYRGAGLPSGCTVRPDRTIRRLSELLT